MRENQVDRPLSAPESPRSPAIVVNHDLRLRYRPILLKMGPELICREQNTIKDQVKWNWQDGTTPAHAQFGTPCHGNSCFVLHFPLGLLMYCINRCSIINSGLQSSSNSILGAGQRSECKPSKDRIVLKSLNRLRGQEEFSERQPLLLHQASSQLAETRHKPSSHTT
eukprot:1160127-Pelagomonas_calceolata.AAC.10